jgi:hypothetical protein
MDDNTLFAIALTGLDSIFSIIHLRYGFAINFYRFLVALHLNPHKLIFTFFLVKSSQLQPLSCEA